MPIQAKCPGCERLLQVDDHLAGKEARCPVCSTIYRVPELVAVAIDAELAGERSPGGSQAPHARDSEALAADLSAVVLAESVDRHENSTWFMRTPEGQTFGPTSWGSLKSWVAEGRITADCQLRADEESWQSADLVFSALRVPPPVYATANPQMALGQAPSAVRSSQPLASHRGGLILTLAMIGFVSGCPILSIMAWVMGNGDLREMREGRMDPEGQGLTQAGYMLGMILSFVWVGVAVVGLFVVLIVAASGK